jgi:uncharacterized protein YggE
MFRFLVVALLAVQTGLFSPAVAKAAGSVVGSIDVSGSGTVEVAPGRVEIPLNLTTADDDLMRVRANSDQQVRQILELVKKHGQNAAGFEVTRMKLSFGYNEQLRRQIYQVERAVVIRLDDLAKLNALLADLLRQPDCKVTAISFVTSKPREHELEALGRAVADAREKATHLAKVNGLKLGRAIQINVAKEESSPFVMSVIPVVGAADHVSPRRTAHDTHDGAAIGVESGDRQMGAAFRLAAFARGKEGRRPVAAKAGDGQPFALGKITVSADVSLRFELVQ